MKFNNIHLSPWSILFLVLLVTGTNSNIHGSAAPLQVPSAGPDTLTPAVHIPDSTESPSYYSTQAVYPVVTQIARKRQGEEGDDRLRHWLKPVSGCNINARGVKICHRTKRSAESVEGDQSSETAGNFRLFKRRLAVNYPARWVNPADVRKRDLPISNILPGEELTVWDE
jgi:hypothetical protein